MAEKKNKILVIDDEAAIRRMLGLFLKDSGYKVIECEDAKSAIRLTNSIRPDLIILDLGLPDMAGELALETLGLLTKAPIIVISGRPEEEAGVAMLDAGAYDYISKPFNVEIMLARVRAALRKSAIMETGEADLENGAIRMDLIRHEAFFNGSPISLTPKEYDLLRHFIINRGKMLTHRNILAEVWGPAQTENLQYLRVYVGQLRSKLNEFGDASQIIVSESGIGYRMEIL